MAKFINTIDVLGDDVVVDSIIDRTIAEFRDDVLTKIGGYAFAGCTTLTEVELPNVTTIGLYPFHKCTSLKSINMPMLVTIEGAYNPAFNGLTSLKSIRLDNLEETKQQLLSGCPALVDVYAPKITVLANGTFQNCTNLARLDMPVLSVIQINAFYNTIVTTLIIRTNTVCSLMDVGAFSECPMKKGTGYIYVPRALIDSYKAATNWSTYANQFRALEDYTVDGTVTGKFLAGTITYNLTGFGSSNSETFVLNSSYQTTLTAWGDNASVTITMDGVDVTNEVYNIETGEVNIPKVAGDVVITASANTEVLSIPTWYSLPEPTTFNGSSDYIDTGIKLFNTAKNFTIIVDATFDRLAKEKCLFHCMTENSPYPGLSIDGNSGVRICYTGSNSLVASITPASNVSALALRYKAGKLDRIRYKNAAGQLVSHSIAGTPTYTAISQTLLLGAYQQTDGTKGRFFNGTINDFRLYDAALDDDIIDILLTVI